MVQMDVFFPFKSISIDFYADMLGFHDLLVLRPFSHVFLHFLRFGSKIGSLSMFGVLCAALRIF